MTTAEAKELDLINIRDEFPALEQRVQGRKLVYLDSACTALKPRAVAERLGDFYLHWGGCGGKRSTHLASQQVQDWLEEARRTAADFISAESPNEIVFTSGTTEAANLLARAFPFDGERREVVLTDLEHNAIFLPFHEACLRGEVSLRFCPSRDGRVDLDALEGLISEKTALVCMTRASNVYGGIQPLAQASHLAHRRGALIFSDEAQYVATHREKVQEVNADFIAFSAHKIGGPFGAGVLYGKENLLNRLKPAKVGGGTVKSVVWERGASPLVEYLDAPARFEAGVPDFAAILGMKEAVDFLRRIPEEELRAHVSALVRRLARGLARFPELRVLGREEDLAKGALVSFHPVQEGFSVADFNLFLNHELGERFIAIRAGEHCAHLLHQRLALPATLRVSFFAYNTAEEVDFFLEAVGSYLRALYEH
ncbi:MAG: aminotransferase class V-fold PLP-dependent enzyme [Elusimicrobia bacterium]|nr:aminotransferase class V-fold PLP-dependent enzyme [Elusimicrobiota bacterium]